ncbi:MAG: hypothetical protein NUW01_07465 [Gemmatimonadaceae bacterium]|nr:hypothetical protein [Gemmatimonadaceae bacterium]
MTDTDIDHPALDAVRKLREPAPYTVPRILPGLTYEEYDALPGIRSGDLKRMATSPLHYREGDGGADTASRVELRAMHAAILEPETFGSSFAACSVRQSLRDKAFQAWCVDHPDQDPLTDKQIVKVNAVAEAIRRHPIAGPMLAAPGRSELTLQWCHPATGLLCKARLDRLSEEWGHPLVVDLKGFGTTVLRRLASLVVRQGAHVQAAHYAEGAAICLGRELRDVWSRLVVYETAKPNDVGVVQLDHDGARFAGQKEREELLVKIVEHEASGEWPGALPHIEVLELPPWAWGEDEDQLIVEETP